MVLSLRSNEATYAERKATNVMPWTWRYEKSDGTPVPSDGLQEAIFASQGDAESWLGENWRALLDSGVDQVILLDDTRVEYGPMSLHPENLRPLRRRLGPRGVPLDLPAEHFIDARHQIVRQPHPGTLDVLLDLLRPGSADDRRRDVRV